MSYEKFITAFSDAIEDESVLSQNADASFRELESWDSLAAMSIIAMIDQEYGVTMKADEMRSANTFKELYELVQTKL